MMHEMSLSTRADMSAQARTQVVDAHHHLWHFNEAEFGWIDDRMNALRRDFLPEDLSAILIEAGVDSTVVVQARESIEETEWLLDCAGTVPAIKGVVGWAPLSAENIGELLDSFHAERALVGFREILQGRPSGYFDQPRFHRGIRQLTERGFTYDVLVYQHQLEEAIKLVDQHPNQRFVLDHAAKPSIALEEKEPWKTRLEELSKRPHVVCKLSGLVTEADWSRWDLESLRPYIDACVQAFGPSRLMAGSDWPVCLVATSYKRWWEILTRYFENFSSAERDDVFGGTATRFYDLHDNDRS
jgi:L-fuconolactonase